MTSAAIMNAACRPASGTAGIDGCDARQQQCGHAEREADPQHRRWFGLTQSWQQHHRCADARHHQHEGECPGGQRGEQCGGVVAHEPPIAIIRSNSICV